jgi:hypothetical protein
MPTSELHVTFKILYLYDFITQLCRLLQEAKVIHNYANATVRNTGQGEAIHRKYKRLKLGGGGAYDRSGE